MQLKHQHARHLQAGNTDEEHSGQLSAGYYILRVQHEAGAPRSSGTPACRHGLGQGVKVHRSKEEVSAAMTPSPQQEGQTRSSIITAAVSSAFEPDPPMTPPRRYPSRARCPVNATTGHPFPRGAALHHPQHRWLAKMATQPRACLQEHAR